MHLQSVPAPHSHRHTMDKASKSEPGRGLGWRHVQVLIMFLSACVGITIRVCLSVAVVGMMDTTSQDGQQHFDWAPTEKSTVLGSFLWGYMVSQVAGGSLSSRWRATVVFTLAISTSGVITALLPLVAQYGGSAGVTGIRVVTGLVQGAMYPSTYTMMGRWIPPNERSRAGSLLLASQPLGNVVSMALSGVISYAWGWPAIFYVFGLAGVVMGAIFYVVSADSPDSHPYISKAEVDYIHQSILAGAKPKAKRPVPWRAIFRSSALISLLAAVVGYLWGYWVLIACTPSYLRNLLDVGIEWNGLLSAAPQLSMLLCSFLFGWLGDFIAKKQLLSISTNRKVLNSIGEWGAGVTFLFIAIFGPGNPKLAVSLLVVAGGLISATFSGCLINFVDLSPNFSGILFAMGNTVGSFVSAFAPYGESVFVDPKDPMPGWSNVFYMTSVVYVVMNLVWCVWGSAEVQPWNDIPSEDSTSQVERGSDSDKQPTDAGRDNAAFDGHD